MTFRIINFLKIVYVDTVDICYVVGILLGICEETVTIVCSGEDIITEVSDMDIQIIEGDIRGDDTYQDPSETEHKLHKSAQYGEYRLHYNYGCFFGISLSDENDRQPCTDEHVQKKRKMRCISQRSSHY